MYIHFEPKHSNKPKRFQYFSNSVTCSFLLESILSVVYLNWDNGIFPGPTTLYHNSCKQRLGQAIQVPLCISLTSYRMYDAKDCQPCSKMKWAGIVLLKLSYHNIYFKSILFGMDCFKGKTHKSTSSEQNSIFVFLLQDLFHLLLNILAKLTFISA